MGLRSVTALATVARGFAGAVVPAIDLAFGTAAAGARAFDFGVTVLEVAVGFGLPLAAGFADNRGSSFGAGGSMRWIGGTMGSIGLALVGVLPAIAGEGSGAVCWATLGTADI